MDLGLSPIGAAVPWQSLCSQSAAASLKSNGEPAIIRIIGAPWKWLCPNIVGHTVGQRYSRILQHPIIHHEVCPYLSSIKYPYLTWHCWEVGKANKTFSCLETGPFSTSPLLCSDNSSAGTFMSIINDLPTVGSRVSSFQK